MGGMESKTRKNRSNEHDATKERRGLRLIPAQVMEL